MLWRGTEPPVPTLPASMLTLPPLLILSLSSRLACIHSACLRATETTEEVEAKPQRPQRQRSRDTGSDLAAAAADHGGDDDKNRSALNEAFRKPLPGPGP